MAGSRKLSIEIVGDAKGLGKAFGDAEKGAKSFGDEMDGAGAKADGFGGKLGGMGTAAVAAGAVAGAALIGLGVASVGAFQDLGITVGKFSDATGIAKEDASRLIEVAGDVGIGADTLEGALGKMLKTLGGNEEAFKKYGVEVQKTKDGQIDANATFVDAIGTLNGIKDPAERAKAGAEIFGKGWASMAELIEQGAPKLKTNLAAVSDAKIFDEKKVQDARKLREGFDQIGDAAGDLLLVIGGALAPVIADLAPKLASVVEKIAPLAETLGESLVDAVSGVEPVIDGAIEAVELLMPVLRSAIEIATKLGEIIGDMGVDSSHAMTDAQKKELEPWIEKVKEAGLWTKQMGDDMKYARLSVDDLKDVMEKAGPITVDLSEDMAAAATNGGDFGDKVETAGRKTAVTDTAIEDLDRTVGSFDDALLELSPTMQGYIDKVNAAEAATRAADDAYTALMGKLDGEESWITAQQAIDGYIWKTRDGVTNTDALHQEFLKIAPDLATYVANLEDVPPEVKTQLYAALEREDIDTFNQLLDALPVSKTVSLSVQSKLDAGAKWLMGGGVSGLTGKLQGGLDGDPLTELAEGGIVRRRPGGMRAIIGEGRHDEAVIPLPDGWASENGLSYLSGDNVLSNESPGADARLGQFISMLTVVGENQLATSENVLAASRNELATSENQMTVNEYQWAAGENQLATSENVLATSENVLAASENGLKYLSGDNVLSNESHGISMLLAQVGNLVTVLGENQISSAGENQSRFRGDNVIFKGDLIIDNHAAQKIVIADNRFKRGAL